MTTPWRLKEKLKTKYNITKLLLYKKGNKRKTLLLEIRYQMQQPEKLYSQKQSIVIYC